jgi:hypothetical protein
MARFSPAGRLTTTSRLSLSSVDEAAARKFDEVFQMSDNQGGPERDIRISLENGKRKQEI